MNSPATNTTRKQNATWAAIIPCIRRRRAWGSSPPLSALTGLTPEARKAGAKPKSKITPTIRSTPNPSTLQSAGSIKRAGLSGVLISRTTNGADHQAKAEPSREAPAATIALSTSTICTSRNRPAPIETRSAISRALAAASAVIRLATLAQAMRSTRPTNTPSHASARRYSSCIVETPDAAGSSSNFWFRKLAMLCFDSPFHVLDRSVSKLRLTAATFARSGSMSLPGFMTTRVRCQLASERVTHGCIIVGRKISVMIPGSVPVKGSGPTPTISKTLSPIRRVLPITFGSRPNRRFQ